MCLPSIEGQDVRSGPVFLGREGKALSETTDQVKEDANFLRTLMRIRTNVIGDGLIFQSSKQGDSHAA